MKRFLVIAALLSSVATPSYAGLNEGVAAATAGDYPRAFTEFEPLAAAGDPAAQYYLAKLYLEGRGPADGVIRGVDLMTKAANGGYPEAQAQLGLMYAMGLGVNVDNVKAHDWLTKAVTALPDGMRRTVAVANRDAVLQRMTPDQRNALASRTIPTTSTTTVSKPAEAAAPKSETTKVATTTPPPATAKPTASGTKTAATDAKKPETTQVAAAMAETKQPDVPVVKTQMKPAESKPADAATKAAAADTKPAEAKPAATQTAATGTKPADAKPAEATPATTQTAATQTKPAETNAAAKPTATQAAAATPATEAQVKAAVRIQIASLPTEDGAWAGWKELSARHANQFTGLTPIVESADLGDLGTRYRIQVGPFQTVADANARCDAMKKAGLDCLVVGKQ